MKYLGAQASPELDSDARTIPWAGPARSKRSRARSGRPRSRIHARDVLVLQTDMWAVAFLNGRRTVSIPPTTDDSD
jgi:hypothetical protein